VNGKPAGLLLVAALVAPGFAGAVFGALAGNAALGAADGGAVGRLAVISTASTRKPGRRPTTVATSRVNSVHSRLPGPVWILAFL
jgi:hypothetical protein